MTAIEKQSSLVMIQYPAKADVRCFRSVDFKKAHTWAARFLSIYLTYEWFVFSTRSNLERRFEFKVMTIQIPWVFLNYILGLWLSTTKIGLKYKKLSYFLLLPSLLMSPAIAGFPYDIMGWLSLFVAIWSYRIIYKTERPVS